MAIGEQTELATRKCVPCHGGVPAMEGHKLQELLSQVEGWELIEPSGIVGSPGVKKIARNFKFHDFAAALKFVNQVGALAEQEDHHPDICLGWGKVRVEFSTHAAKGLSENDFIMAAKVDQIPR